MNFKSPKYVTGIKRVLLITTGWTIAAIYVRLIQYFTLINASAPNLPVYYNIENIITFTLAEVFLSGIVVASFEVFYFTDKFRKKSFTYAVIVKSLFYTISLTIISFAIYYIESVYFNELQKFIFNNILIVLVMNFFIWGLIFLITEFILQVSDKYGQGVLMNFILGKYHNPKEEIRIFMFIDMKSSTSIAESLGNIKYFNLLNDVFYDITDAIVDNKGEIYQYVGDEIVISWNLESGLENANCLNCFFSVEKALLLLKKNYMNKFGVFPEFKAGIHYGEVTVGEVGVLKREITFSGDVLNTTSRIQELCNSYNERLIVSGDLIDKIDLQQLYILKKIGEISLRGRSVPVKLFSVDKMKNSL